MATRQDVDDFLAQKQIAFVGVSRDPIQFANKVYQALRDRGYGLYPVNPQAKELEGVACYPSLADLPEPVGFFHRCHRFVKGLSGSLPS